MSFKSESGEFDFLSVIRQFHKEFIEPYKGKPQGCQESEIKALEKNFKFELPLAYKQYLAWMGRDYNGIFVGCDWFISDVYKNTELVPELLDENKVLFQLPENFLCFFSHQGYMAAWFELPKLSENPPAWFYQEMETERPLLEGTFTDILFKDIRGLTASLYQSIELEKRLQ